MIKTIVVARRKAGMTHEEFIHYWHHEHAALATGLDCQRQRVRARRVQLAEHGDLGRVGELIALGPGLPTDFRPILGAVRIDLGRIEDAFRQPDVLGQHAGPTVQKSL